MMELLAALSGVSIVVGRMLNAQASARIGLGRSTFNNYWVGLIVSILAMLIAGEQLALPAHAGNAFMYLGGPMGVGVVMLSSMVALRISSLRMTLLSFVSQMAAALALDAWILGSFSIYRAAGVLLVLMGLVLLSLGERDSSPSEKVNDAHIL